MLSGMELNCFRASARNRITPTIANPRNTAEDSVPISATPKTKYWISTINLVCLVSALPEPTFRRHDSNSHYTFSRSWNVSGGAAMLSGHST